MILVQQQHDPSYDGKNKREVLVYLKRMYPVYSIQVSPSSKSLHQNVSHIPKMTQLIVSLEIGGCAKQSGQSFRVVLSDPECFRSSAHQSKHQSKNQLLFCVCVDSVDPSNLVRFVDALDKIAQALPVNRDNVKNLVTALGPLSQLYPVSIDKLATSSLLDE